MDDDKHVQIVIGKKSLIIFGILMASIVLSATILILGQKNIGSVSEDETPKEKVASKNKEVIKVNEDEYNEQSQKIYYVTATANVRECASTTCKVLFTLSINHEIESAYKSLVFMPEWLDVSFDDGVTGYINKSNLSENKTIFITEQQTKKIDNVSTKALSEVVAEWRLRTAYIECTWDSGDGASGSGLVLGVPGEKVQVITNKHVFTDDRGRYASECLIKLPDDNKVYQIPVTDDWVGVGKNDLDWALMTIPEPSTHLEQMISKYFDQLVDEGTKWPQFCSGQVAVGTEVVILGYPSYGSGYDDITATDGIISGYQSPYYTTSAKIEHGNSGGIAILTERNCFVGIPTAVKMGEFESLGRILDASVIWNWLK